ncbi:MAG: 2,3-diphosphoglycerate synthetase [Actinomycetota bacterium]
MIIDGEHYPPVVQSALEELTRTGHEVLGAVMAGGKEKLPASGAAAYGDVELIAEEDPRSGLWEALDRWDAESVLDLSDEPVLDYRRRFELISVALKKGVRYQGSDFALDPPDLPALATKPTLRIIGTGKRTGKTAVAGSIARSLNAEGVRPVVLAMGRGGPEEPEVLHGDEVDLTPQDLLELAEAGKHAASDYVEDALLSRVTTIGCRRCGGGLAGAVGTSNVARGIEIANDVQADLLFLEGSGAAIPPARADATVLIMPASLPLHYLDGYLGLYRLLLADLVVVTMSEEPFGSPSQISSLVSHIRSAWREPQEGEGAETRVVRTVFRPQPTRSVEGASVFVATTAPEVAGENIRRHLEAEHGCKVTGISHALSDRARLEEDLKRMGGSADVLLCEIKAAAIDVATKRALENDMDVVYMDNVPVGIDGDDPHEEFLMIGKRAIERFSG